MNTHVMSLPSGKLSSNTAYIILFNFILFLKLELSRYFFLLECRTRTQLSALLKDFIYYLFLEGGKDREREGEKHRCVRKASIGCLSHTPQPETRPHNTGPCPDQETNLQPFILRDDAQPTELHLNVMAGVLF